MEVIAERKTKTVYRDNDKTIKLFVENYSKSNILNEALNQARVEETGLNVPELLEVTKMENRWALISEHIEGKSLQDIMDENPEKIEEYMDVLAQKAPMLNKLKDKMQRKIAETDLNATIKYDLNTRLESMQKNNQICHGDFNPSNIIIQPDGTPYIIDWAHVTQGNGAADTRR